MEEVSGSVLSAGDQNLGILEPVVVCAKQWASVILPVLVNLPVDGSLKSGGVEACHADAVAACNQHPAAW